jgi:hypothetical protein
MNDDQRKIQAMVLELIEAIRRYPYKSDVVAEITSALPGILDGTFFDHSPEDQRGLGWVSGAFFGRGERAIPLFMSGVLRGDFDQDFYTLLQQYWRSDVFPQPEPVTVESMRAARKLEKRLKKANKSCEATGDNVSS